jgi:hypothetical protein
MLLWTWSISGEEINFKHVQGVGMKLLKKQTRVLTGRPFLNQNARYARYAHQEVVRNVVFIFDESLMLKGILNHRDSKKMNPDHPLSNQILANFPPLLGSGNLDSWTELKMVVERTVR